MTASEEVQGTSAADQPQDGKLSVIDIVSRHAEALEQGHTDVDETASVLASTLGLTAYLTDAHAAIRLDYVTYCLSFAREARYGPARTASLLTVSLSLLDATAGGATYPEVEGIFKSELVRLTSPKPGHDSELFSPDQVAAVAHFMARTFFRHWRLYAYVFSHSQELSECTQGLLVETAVFPSFEGAVAEEDWTAAQAAATAARVAEAAAAMEAAAAAAEEAKVAAVQAAVAAEEQRRAEELLRKPATLEEAVEHLVAIRLDAERKVLSAEYAAKEDVLLKKINEMETRSGPPPSTPTKK